MNYISEQNDARTIMRYNMKHMTLSTKPYKGARDFYPEDKRIQKYILDTWRNAVERFGYEEYDAPMLESLELYKAKTGEEIVNEQTYTFTDRGGREVVIRPEMTPTVSRMVAAKRQELPYPLRWYSIPNLWRYERAQRGRLREHWQLNVDLFGVSDSSAEHEMVLVADAIMKAFGATPSMYEIRINSRKLMTFVMDNYLGLDSVQQNTLSKLIDRMHKIPHAEFVAEADAMITPTQRESGISDKLLSLLEAKTIMELPDAVLSSEPAQELRRLLETLQDTGVNNALFDITIMRGFDYYTGIVFELTDTDPENNRSMAGGGRYDGLVGLFGVEPLPTVGFGSGDVTMRNFLESHGLLPKLKPSTEVYAVLVGDVYKPAQKVIAKLREEGATVAVDASGRKIAQQIKTAVKLGIPYVLFIGEEELQNEQYKLKNLLTEQESTLSLERIVSKVLDSRAN